MSGDNIFYCSRDLFCVRRDFGFVFCGFELFRFLWEIRYFEVEGDVFSEF